MKVLLPCGNVRAIFKDTKVKLDYYMRSAPRERSLDETQPVFVYPVPLSQLWTESFDPIKWIIVLFWSAGESSTGDVPIPHLSIAGHLLGPTLPPLDHDLVVVPPQQPLIPGQPGSDHFSADDHSVHTPLHSTTDHFSVADESVDPSSRRSSRRSPSVKNTLLPRR